MMKLKIELKTFRLVPPFKAVDLLSYSIVLKELEHPYLTEMSS
jgi:hypothetical protein